MRVTNRGWGVAGLCLGLVACGGGQEVMSVATRAAPLPEQAVQNASACEVSGAAQWVDGVCLRASSLPPAARTRAQAEARAVTLDASSLFDWAEQQYPTLFPGHQTNQLSGIYTYRHYPSTGNYVGLADGKVYALGSFTGGQIAFVGLLTDFSCQVLPSSCALPAAPTGLVATAGNGSISLAFTAPTDTGGSAITRYDATCTAGSTSRTGTGSSSPVVVSGLSNGTAYSCSLKASNSVGTSAASAAVQATPSAGGATGGSSTASVLCSYSYSGYNSSTSVRATSTVAWSCSTSARSLSANGLPDHTVGTFPSADNPNSITSQSVAANMSLSPAVTNANGVAATVVGYALNGVKFDPNTAGTCDNSGSSCSLIGGSGNWKIEALGQTSFRFGVDSSNAHVQPTGEYHYHGMPEGLITKQGKGTAMTLVGWALDGFPIYARYGYTVASDASSALKVLKGSYQLKTTADTGRPSTSTYPMGTFQQDWQYVAGSGDLDECNGRTGVTPEFPQGIYHYVTTDSYPYIQRCLKGTAATGGGGTPSPTPTTPPTGSPTMPPPGGNPPPPRP